MAAILCRTTRRFYNFRPRRFSSLRLSSDGSVWVSRREKGIYRLGVHSAGVGAIDFVDLPAETESIMLVDRGFAMVEGRGGRKGLHSPLSGTIVDRNVALIDAPTGADDDDVDVAWLIEIDAALDDDDEEDEFNALLLLKPL